MRMPSDLDVREIFHGVRHAMHPATMKASLKVRIRFGSKTHELVVVEHADDRVVDVVVAMNASEIGLHDLPATRLAGPNRGGEFRRAELSQIQWSGLGSEWHGRSDKRRTRSNRQCGSKEHAP